MVLYVYVLRLVCMDWWLPFASELVRVGTLRLDRS